MTDDEKLCPRPQVLQRVLDAELHRQWWCPSHGPVFGQKVIVEAKADEAPTAPPVFHGLFGEIPGSDSRPLRLDCQVN